LAIVRLSSISEGVRYIYATWCPCSQSKRLGAGVPITSQQLYSAGTTNDLRQAVLYITHLYPKAPLHGLGFSLGANVMTKYIAEEGAQTRLLSGCALGCVCESGIFGTLNYDLTLEI
jgi:predicted alpha/beta-fold hydrolase